MSSAFVIEVDGAAAGVVLAEAAGLRFYASDRAYWDLDGRLFRSAREAERAAARLVREAPAARDRSDTAAPPADAGIWAETVGRYLGPPCTDDLLRAVA